MPPARAAIGGGRGAAMIKSEWGQAALSAVLAVVLALLFVQSAVAEPRVALVIGNAHYDAGRLTTPINDARLMTAILKRLGFTVMEHEDLDLRGMKQALAEFGSKLSDAGPTATGLFFFGGQGVQVGAASYLIPLYAKIEKGYDVELEAIELALAVKQMDFAGNAVNIVMIDAGRNNDLSTQRYEMRGLADFGFAIPNLFVSYSTAPHQVALDGTGSDSPYVTAVASVIETPGLSIHEIFDQVRAKVFAETERRQLPWDSSGLMAPFYFVPAK
jgi:uncharacterized caspase-like protein